MNVKEALLFWNQVALEANRTDFSMIGTMPPSPQQGGPTLSSRALAIVHLAIHDAYYGIVTPAKSYSGATATALTLADAPVSMSAAAAAALASLFSRQADFFKTKYLEFVESSDMTTPAAKFGAAVGEKILEMRRLDVTADTRYVSVKTANLKQVANYHHDVDPENPMQGFHGSTYGMNKTFSAKALVTLAAPSGLDGNQAAYDAAVKQVAEAGGRNSSPTQRTPDQTLVGLFWAYDGTNQLGTPLRLYNQLLRQILSTSASTMVAPMPEGDWIDLFTLFNVAMGDAAINAWKLKYEFEFWRPVVALRWNPQGPGNADPLWLPVGSPNTDGPGLKTFTPNFPAYPSGHATFGAAAFHMLRRFLKDRFKYDDVKKPFKSTLESDELNGKNMDSSGTLRPYAPRTFQSLAHIIHENAKSRLYLGVHWIFDSFAEADNKSDTGPKDGVYTNLKVGGVPVGIQLADDIFNRYQTNNAIKPS